MPQAPCEFWLLGSQVQAVSELTMALEHLMGKERQGELGEVRLQRTRLRISDHVCKHLMGHVERRGQALLQLPRDRAWSWQCPKVLAASLSSAALGRVCRIPASPEQVPPYKGAAIQMIFVQRSRAEMEELYNVLNALIKSNNCLDCPLFPGRRERGTPRALQSCQIASSERDCPGSTWDHSCTGSISECPGYIPSAFLWF